MRHIRMGWLLLAALPGTASAISTTPQKPTPYWASISAGEARMRTGPGRNYPAVWAYHRAGLPVKVTEVYPGWRKVRDPDGAEGWMLSNLVSDQRMVMIHGEIAELHEKPGIGTRVLWKAEPGVIAHLSKCSDGWCQIDIKGRGGFVEQGKLWGVDAGEHVG